MLRRDGVTATLVKACKWQYEQSHAIHWDLAREFVEANSQALAHHSLGQYV